MRDLPLPNTEDCAPVVSLLGDTALMLQWRGAADSFAERMIPNVVQAIRELQLSCVEDVVPGFESVTICFEPRNCSVKALMETVCRVVNGCQLQQQRVARELTIPVRFSSADSPDLLDVAASAGMSVPDCIALLASVRFRVRMIGFAPGFPYLSGLPECLWLPRLSVPRVSVPAGSFAVAAGQAGIYPRSSPGGWRLLGRTDVVLFEANGESPCLLTTGDIVRIEPHGPLVAGYSGDCGA